MNHNDKGEKFKVDIALASADPGVFDGLVLPGGVVNADELCTYPGAVRFVKAFFDKHKPVAAICHAPWILIEAGVVTGRSLTSWPSLQTDIRNAGGKWVDREVVQDVSLRPAGSPMTSRRSIASCWKRSRPERDRISKETSTQTIIGGFGAPIFRASNSGRAAT